MPPKNPAKNHSRVHAYRARTSRRGQKRAALNRTANMFGYWALIMATLSMCCFTTAQRANTAIAKANAEMGAQLSSAATACIICGFVTLLLACGATARWLTLKVKARRQ